MMQSDIETLNKELHDDDKGDAPEHDDLVKKAMKEKGNFVCYARAIMDYLPNGLTLFEPIHPIRWNSFP